ncbi:methyltransferase domain-containing protein [Vibrio sp. NH-UV-68]|uniref:class I SAM-dependent methyltransferase n=1 Tax=unclassified Vibrio TaxID=2614977 RepID=UPI0036F2DA53
MKNIRPEVDYRTYMKSWSQIYNTVNYQKGAAAYFLKKSHEWLEAFFDSNAHFSKVLEVGAGNGQHIEHVNHSYDRYVMTDLRPEMLETVNQSNPKVEVSIQDATKLSYDDNEFDRVIAAHILEHLPNPHSVLREWTRVLKPGGVLSILIPCDPGFAWRLGQSLRSKANFASVGLDYDYINAREHINAIGNLKVLIDFYFPKKLNVQWEPLKLPIYDCNLFYIVHITI